MDLQILCDLPDSHYNSCLKKSNTKMKKIYYDAKKFVFIPNIMCFFKMHSDNKKLLQIKIFFIKPLQFGNKDDNIDSMKAAFVKSARQMRRIL